MLKLRNASVLVLVLLFALSSPLLAGCGSDDSDSKKKPKKTSSEKKKDSGPADDGDFTVTYEDTDDPDQNDVKELLDESELITTVTDALNETIALPADVDVVFTSEDVGPLYDPSQSAIAMPYSFVLSVYQTLGETGWYDTDEKLITATVETTLFVLLHESAHALVDKLELPVIGKEEDGADALATVLAVEDAEYGDMALSAADLFGATATTDNPVAAYADEHSLDAQRFYTIRCLVYGYDPEEYDYAFEDVEVSEEQLAKCPGQFEQASTSWNKLLEPYLL